MFTAFAINYIESVDCDQDECPQDAARCYWETNGVATSINSDSNANGHDFGATIVLIALNRGKIRHIRSAPF